VPHLPLAVRRPLLDFIKSDFNIDVYWKTLNDNGVSARAPSSAPTAPGPSEPRFCGRAQREGLLRDLAHYLKTLKGSTLTCWPPPSRTLSLFAFHVLACAPASP